mgnify:CR=1 FL=1|jgi:hypothetical protein
MKLFKFLSKGKYFEPMPNRNELFQARFEAGFNCSCSAEEYDSNLLQIPLQRIYFYKEKFNQIRLFEKDHLLFNKETSDYRNKIESEIEDKYEFHLYSSYLRDRGIRKIILYDANRLSLSLRKTYQYELSFNMLTHYIETYGPCCQRTKEYYASMIQEIDNINDWERFYSYKVSNGSVKSFRREYAKKLLEYTKIDNSIRVKTGGKYSKKYKTAMEYYEDTTVTCFSKECLAIVLYKKDISEDIAGAIAYGYLDAYYYKQYGVAFIVFKFVDSFKFTYYFNIKENNQSEEWLRSDSKKIEIWLVDRVSYELKSHTRFDLNAIPSIKRCLKIIQGPSSKKEIQETALSLMKEYNTDEIIKISVGSERVYSNS